MRLSIIVTINIFKNISKYLRCRSFVMALKTSKPNENPEGN